MLSRHLFYLAVIPPFMDAADNAMSMLAEDGIVGVADFYTSAKYDLPNRQHSYRDRWFWRATFDLDGIDLGPERRTYLDHNLETGTKHAHTHKCVEIVLLRIHHPSQSCNSTL